MTLKNALGPLRVALLAGCCIFLVLLSACSTKYAASDRYPGDEAYTEKVQNLLQRIRDDSMDFPWHRQYGVSKRQLCSQLVERHFQALNRGMSETNAAWLVSVDITQASLEAACFSALANPRGFGQGIGFAAWKGVHKGTWYEPNQWFCDEAVWAEPAREPCRLAGRQGDDGQPLICDIQKVNWPNRKVGRFGWHQSHPEINYLWGWDPKDIGNEDGDIGMHIGFPFEIGSCSFIIWITPKVAFLEGINTGRTVTRTLNGNEVTGYPKTSAALTGGCGQWIVER
jgi:hypothetical protein